jgi:hypothetical protein
MAIAHNAQDKTAVLARVLLVLVVSSLAAAPYVKWRRSHHGRMPA